MSSSRAPKAARWGLLTTVASLLLVLQGVAWARPTQHLVVAGDNLGAIARRYACTIAEVRRANRLNDDRIRRGQMLRIPACTGVARPPVAGHEYTVPRGASLGSIAAAVDCTVQQLRVANGLRSDRIAAGQTLHIPRCDRPVQPMAPARVARRRRGPRRSRPRSGTDTRTLPRLMRERGFHPPKDFKAVVVEVTLDAPAGANIVAERYFAWGATAQDPSFNPASTVKIFAAIAALERVRANGFSPRAVATFHDPGHGSHRHTVRELVEKALVESSNHSYNRLVQLAGYDYLNGRVLSAARGIKRSGIHKPYARSTWMPLTGAGTLRDSPRIELRERSRRRTLPARRGSGSYPCAYSAACTTVRDLAEGMRRLMLHEQLPPGQRLKLSDREILLMRKALRKHRRRGMEVVDGLERALRRGGHSVMLYHKPGFSMEWMSDVIYVYQRRSKRRWIVSLAGYGGRDCLDRAATVIGQLIASGALSDG